MLGLLFPSAVCGLAFAENFILLRDKTANQLVAEDNGRLVMMDIESAKKGGLGTAFSLKDSKLRIEDPEHRASERFACIKFNIYRFFMGPNDIEICNSGEDRNTDWDILEGPNRKFVIRSKSRQTCMGYSFDPQINSPLKEVDCFETGYNTLFDMLPPDYLQPIAASPILPIIGGSSKFSSSYSYRSSSASSSGSRRSFN